MKKILMGMVCISLLLGSPAMAEELDEAISNMLKSHERLQEAQAREVSAENKIRVALGGWFPKLDLTASAGTSEYRLEDVDDLSQNPKELDASITQLLWDFGLTNARLRKARNEYLRYSADKERVRQELILEGNVAYLELKNAEDIIQYAQQSENNIKHQTEMENTRITRGQGYSTDVLQSKSQLLGAQARLVSARGVYERAKNRVQRVFGRLPDEISALTTTDSSPQPLPATVDEAVQVAMKSNPNLKVADFAVKEADALLSASKADGYLPVINGVLQADVKDEVGGIEARREDYVAKVELSYSFNLGLTATNKVRSAREDYAAAVKNRDYLKKQVEEQVRNSWANVDTARTNSSFLNSQVDILEQFLELARKERKLGRRSLLDVLAGETNLINAKSDAASAKTDVKININALLETMGKL